MLSERGVERGWACPPSCPHEASSLLEERVWLERLCQAGGAERFLALKPPGSHTDMRLRCLDRAQELDGACALVLVGSGAHTIRGISTWRSLASSRAQELSMGT